MRPRLVALTWMTGSAAAGAALLRLGRLDGMTVDWEDLGAWLASTDLELVLASFARLGGLALVGWMTLSTAVYAVARLAGTRHTLRWLSIPPLRRAVDALVAGSLLFGTMTPAVAADAPGPTPAQEAVHPAYVPVPAGPEPAPPTAEAAPPPPAPEPAPPRTTEPASVVVEPGDNLWVIAERRLADVLGRPPRDSETAPYWMRVVEENRGRIRSGDPDLIFPGEEIVLPDL